MVAIRAIINLLSTISVEYREIKLINELNNFFNFDHNIFLADSSVDMNLFIGRQGVTPRSLYVESDDDNYITGWESLTNITSKNTFIVVVPGSSTFDNNLQLLNRILDIESLYINVKIGIFFPYFVSRDDLQHLFHWAKEQVIVNIFAAAYLQPVDSQEGSSEDFLNIFAFHPFRAFEVINVTGSNNYFPTLDSNFHQHELRLGESFGYKTHKELWLTIFPHMNASFTIVMDKWSKLSELVDNKIDVLPNMYQVNEATNYDVYPLEIENSLIMVPVSPPYSEFSAYLRTVTSDKFFSYSLITTATVMLLLSLVRYIKQRRILFFQSVADVLNLLMNDNGYINYQRLSRVEVFLIVPLTFVGLVIVNGIFSNLQSYLTLPVLQPQINTIEDLYRSPVPILTINDERKSRLINDLANQTKLDWTGKITGLERKPYTAQLLMFNRSTAHYISLKKTILVLEVQKRLNIKGYQTPRIQLGKYYGALKILPKFRFVERLNEMIHRLQSAGLYDLWCRRERQGFQKDMIKTSFELLRKQNEIVVENFEFPMFIAYGWLASVIVLVIEIIWKNFKLSRVIFSVQKVARKIAQFCRIVAEKVED